MSIQQTHILVRYAEIGIKGNNRSEFENMLVRNIRACLNAHAIFFESVSRSSGRIIIKTNADCTELREIFGIASWSIAIDTGTTIKELFSVVHSLVSFTDKTFKVACTRVDKRFALTSMEVNCQLGELLCTATGARVKMHSPDILVECEIVEQHILYCLSTQQGLGGLPVGSSSQVLVLAENHDELRAALAMLKRGCSILLATSKPELCHELAHFSHGHEITHIPQHHAQEASAHILLAAVPDVYNSIKEYKLHCPIVRPLIGG